MTSNSDYVICCISALRNSSGAGEIDVHLRACKRGRRVGGQGEPPDRKFSKIFKINGKITIF